MQLEYSLHELAAERPARLCDARPRSREALLKRLLDIAGALVLVLVLWPLLLLAIILVKIASPGPVLFRQKRPGLNRVPFMIYKLRTMHLDAEGREAEIDPSFNGIFFKAKSDPRIFPIGRFFRKYSIDELPQLFNVLKGDMSLVGPRPVLGGDLKRFAEWKQMRRFQVKPGLTGLWQINGRSNTTDAQRMRDDLLYVEKHCFTLDLKILVRTIPAVLKGEGAV